MLLLSKIIFETFYVIKMWFFRGCKCRNIKRIPNRKWNISSLCGSSTLFYRADNTAPAASVMLTAMCSLENSAFITVSTPTSILSPSFLNTVTFSPTSLLFPPILFSSSPPFSLSPFLPPPLSTSRSPPSKTPPPDSESEGLTTNFYESIFGAFRFRILILIQVAEVEEGLKGTLLGRRERGVLTEIRWGMRSCGG